MSEDSEFEQGLEMLTVALAFSYMFFAADRRLACQVVDFSRLVRLGVFRFFGLSMFRV